MDLKDRVTMTIHSCNKFSDVWDVTLELIRRNWPDNNMRKILVTDDATEKQYDNVEVFSAGTGLDMPIRNKKVLETINTDYVFFTLDDYFLVDRVNDETIQSLIDIMDRHGIDYLSFGNRHKKGELLDIKQGVYRLDMSIDENYIINLYPAIWRKSFMEMTVKNPKSIWEYEVSLTEIAKELNAICCTCDGSQFKFIDGIRKGKFLHKSYKYLQEHELYHGDRSVITYREEIKLNIIYKIKKYMPKYVREKLKIVLRKMGYHFYS